MTRVDFYILSGTEPEARLNLVCRLTEKAVSQGNKVFINTYDMAMSNDLDKRLWCFRADSFLPHCVISNAAEQTAKEAVLIAHNVEPDGSRPVMINLAAEVPFFFSRFERTLEIINDEQEIKARGRDRWSFYKDRGYPLQHHKL